MSRSSIPSLRRAAVNFLRVKFGYVTPQTDVPELIDAMTNFAKFIREVDARDREQVKEPKSVPLKSILMPRR